MSQKRPAAAPQPDPVTQQKGSVPAAPNAVAVTYTPGRDDPVVVIWNRKTFEANRPVMLIDPELIAKAKRNPWFKVDGEPQAKRGFDPVNDQPKTATEYRAYTVAWIRTAKSSAELARRWKNETALRDACECGTDDDDYLSRFYDPRFAELKRMEDAGEAPQDVVGG